MAKPQTSKPITSTTERPIPLVARHDLVRRQQWFGGESWLIVHDPIALRYFYFRGHEQFVFERLDGEISIDDLRAAFAHRFAPSILSVKQLTAFLEQLHKQGLVLGTLPGQGAVLATKRQKHEAWPISRLVSALLSPRLRGIDAETWLRPWLPLVSWFFSPLCATIMLTLVAVVFILALTQLPTIIARLESSATNLAPQHLLLLPVVLIFVKTLHELAHAFVCMRMGARVPEMGVQLLLLTPCLYCNVSDSWLLASRWKRMAVAAAGMYVELVLAALFGLLWWASLPGVINSLSLQAMVICSIGTLVVNANPLLRYDGYYLLSDWLEIPNLEQRSRRAFATIFAQQVFGLTPPPALLATTERDAPLAFYALFSGIYRIFVLVSAYWILSTLGRAWKIEAMVGLLLFAALTATLLPIVQAFFRQWRESIMQRQFSFLRFAFSTIFACGAVGAIVMVPLPSRVDAPLLVIPQGATPIYVTSAGLLRSVARAGDTIGQGEVLAKLDNSALTLDLARIESETRAQEKKLDALQTMRGIDDSVEAIIPAETVVLQDMRERTEQLRDLANRLTIHSPREGVVLAPGRAKREVTKLALTTWYGTPLDPENIGSYLDQGTLLCEVGDPTKLEATAVLAESDLEQVRIGQSVAVIVFQEESIAVEGTIIDIAKASESATPSAMTNSLLESDEVSSEAKYQVRIELQSSLRVLPYATGKARIRVDSETIARRLWRLFSKTFQLSRGL